MAAKYPESDEEDSCKEIELSAQNCHFRAALSECRELVYDAYFSISRQVQTIAQILHIKGYIIGIIVRDISETRLTSDSWNRLIGSLLHCPNMREVFYTLIELFTNEGRDDVTKIMLDTLTEVMKRKKERRMSPDELYQGLHDFQSCRRCWNDTTVDLFDQTLETLLEVRDGEANIHHDASRAAVSTSEDIPASVATDQNAAQPSTQNVSTLPDQNIEVLSGENVTATQAASASPEQHSASTNIETDISFTQLMIRCIECEDPIELQNILTQFPNTIREMNEARQTALMIICQLGSPQLLKILLRNSLIDINQQDMYGRTCLFYALLRGDREMIELLLQNDTIDLAAVDNVGLSYIWYALGINVVEYMAGVWQLKRGRDQASVLNHFIAGLSRSVGVEWSKICEFVDWLLTLNYIDHADLLRVFTLIGRPDIVMAVLNKRHLTISPSTLTILIINAIISGNKSTLNVLLNHTEIDLTILSDSDVEAIIISTMIHNRRCVSTSILLATRGLNVDHAYRLVLSLQTLKSDALWFILDSYTMTNLNVRDKNNRTVFQLLCLYGGYGLVSEMIEREEIQVGACDDQQRSTFMLALGNRSLDIAKLLLTHPKGHVDGNYCDSSGVSNLAWACLCGSEELVTLFLHQPMVNVNNKDKKDRNSLSYAVASGNREIVSQLLKQQNIDVNHQDTRGKSALDYALDAGDEQVVYLIKSRSGIHSCPGPV